MDIPMTPAPPGRFKSMFRSILREKNTPGSGQSVRWGARDAYRTITPNTSATSAEGAPSTPLLEDEESNSFMGRLQDESSDDHGEKIDQLAAMGQSVGSRFAAPGSTTPPMPGPSKAPGSSLPPIPRPRFNPSAPSTSSPLGQDDSNMSFTDSMSPAPKHWSSHRPFDMSREMDSIPNIVDDSSPVVSDSSVSARRTSRPGRPSILPPSDSTEDAAPFVSAADMSGASDDVTQQARSHANNTAGPSKSVRGMTTLYPPGMYNLTKSRVNATNPIPSFSVEPEPEPVLKPRAKQRDAVGSSSLDFIISPGATLSSSGRARTSLPPPPLPPFDPPPVPTSSRPLSASNLLFQPPASHRASLARSVSPSNSLGRATTTRTFRLSARELPTLYPPGGYMLDPTQIDPDNIPELSRFFPPETDDRDASRIGPDTSRESVTIGHRHSASVGSVGSQKSLQLLDPDQSNASTVSPSRVPLPASKSLSRSRPNSLSSTSSLSGATPNSLADLTQLIESQYKADLAAHTALVPILLSRAETAEGSAQRLACVVKDARARVKELERLCKELGHEVGLLKRERSELVADRDRVAGERDDLRNAQAGLESRLGDTSTERESLLSEIGNLSTDLDTLAQAQTARGVLDMASGQAMREIHVQLSRAEKEAKRSLRRRDERDEARARLFELQARVDEIEKSRAGWGEHRGALETEVRDLEVRVEREKDGSGAKEAFALERQQWEKERTALLDRAVRAEQALDAAGVTQPGDGDQKLRRQLDEYKAEVESQWKYAEQADATIKALEADIKQLRQQMDHAPKAGLGASGPSGEWRIKEAQWERERAEWADLRTSWEAERARWEEKQAEVDNLKEDVDALMHERDAYMAELDEVRAEFQRSKKSRGNELEKAEAEMKRMEEDMATLADRAHHAEEMYVSPQNELRTAETVARDLKDQVKAYENANHNLKQFQDELETLQAEREGMESERSDLLRGIEQTEKQLRDLEVRCVRAENDRVEVIRDRAEIEDELERVRVELEDMRHERGLLEQERNVLAEELRSEQSAHAALANEHRRVSSRLDDLDREHQSSLDTIRRLERIVQARNTELAQTEESIRTQALEAEQLRSHTRELERIKAQRDDALQAESHIRSQLEDSQKLRDAESAELSKLRDRVKHLVDETTRSQRRVNELMTESADKEVRIVQLSKARAQDLEDKEGLNVALQSKQQELELIKRKLGVRGTAGATPAPSRMQRGGYSRRESTASSVAMETPLPRGMVRKEYPEPTPSDSADSVSSYSVAATPLQSSSRANIYATGTELTVASTPSTVKANRRVSDSAPVRSSLRYSSVSRQTTSVSSFRGVHFAASESTESETEASDLTIQQALPI